MAKKRNRIYADEYRRRIERALARGLSRSQARGHRKPSEARVTKNRAQKALEDHRLQMGLRFFRKEKNFAKAAKQAGLSTERLRTEAVEKGIVEKHGRCWVIKQNLPRRVLIYRGGREHIIVVGNFKAASLVGKHMSAVGSFVRTADISHQRPFIGKTVKDIDGKSYVLETRPNVLYRLSHAGGSSFQQIYRILV